MISSMTAHEEERYIQEIIKNQKEILDERLMTTYNLKALGDLISLTGNPVLLNCVTFTMNAILIKEIKKGGE